MNRAGLRELFLQGEGVYGGYFLRIIFFSILYLYSHSLCYLSTVRYNLTTLLSSKTTNYLKHFIMGRFQLFPTIMVFELFTSETLNNLGKRIIPLRQRDLELPYSQQSFLS
jgi:hypothetical protein